MAQNAHVQKHTKKEFYNFKIECTCIEICNIWFFELRFYYGVILYTRHALLRSESF